MTYTTIGIDISKDHLDVATYPEGEVSNFKNNHKGLNKFLAWLNQQSFDLIIFEATGAYHKNLENRLAECGLPYTKVNPQKVRYFAKATGRLAKNDRLDALVLAQFGALLKPSCSESKSQTTQELHELLGAYQALVKERTAVTNRLHNATNRLVKQQLQHRLQHIEEDLKAIIKACKALIEQDENLAHKFAILLTIPGIGEVTALILLAEMPELGTMNKKQVASLAGLAPMTRQSGKWQGKSFIQGGRRHVRKAIYMPALVACRFNPVLKQKYQALIATGKPKKMAITAIMRKLITIANALIRDNRKWNENYS